MKKNPNTAHALLLTAFVFIGFFLLLLGGYLLAVEFSENPGVIKKIPY